MKQKVHYLTTEDQTRIAWAVSGKGAPMVKTANWITHLEYDWESPVFRHWVEFMSEHFQLVRYDERGNGLSQLDVESLALKHWTGDLEAVVEASKPQMPFTLLGISQGSVAAITYAVRYPERVSKLVIYGGYSKGWKKREDAAHVREFSAIVDLVELGWGRAEPAFRRVFTQRFLPKGSEEQLNWFDRHCAKTTNPKMAARLLQSRGNADVRHLLSKVSVPTLILHAQDDRVVPFRDGQELAAGIKGAELVALDSCNHILREDEPAWTVFKEAVLEFTGVAHAVADQAFSRLSKRELEILSGLVSGKNNAQLGQSLFISEKTVRNHLTNIFEKLQVKSRSEAIVKAHAAGYQQQGASARVEDADQRGSGT